MRAAGHRLFARQPGQLRRIDLKPVIAEACAFLTLALIAHFDVDFGFSGAEFD